MGKKKGAAAAVEVELTSPQKKQLAVSRGLQRRAVDAGILTPAKPDQYPRLEPSKGAWGRV
jgi:hypothetical protein